jgi:germination protein M
VWRYERLMGGEKKKRALRLRVTLLVVLVAAFLLLGGCNLTDQIKALKGDKPQTQADLPSLGPAGTQTAVKPPEKLKVTLFFRDPSGSYLVAKTEEIDKVPGIARATLSALCQGPTVSDCRASLPTGSGVRDLNVKSDGLCVVDLNQSVANLAEKDAKSEALAVYSVVNTLTEFSTVKKVQILIGGQVQKTLAGHIPIDEPLLRNLTFVRS